MKINSIYRNLIRLQDILPGKSVWEAVSLLDKAEHWTRERGQIHQGIRLNVILSNAKNNVPYYEDFLQDYDINNREYRYNVEYISQLPILTKTIIREHHDVLKSTLFSKYKPRIQRTGGEGDVDVVRVMGQHSHEGLRAHQPGLEQRFL